MVSTADLPLVTPAPDPAAVAQTPSLIPSLSALKDEALPETPTTPTTAARRKMKTLEDEELERQIEALAVPGYSIHQEGVFTVITRVEKSGRSRTFPARIARWLLQSDKWLPLLIRYAKEAFLLSPWRMCVELIYKLVQSQMPLARLWASARMRHIVEKAIETGRVDKMKLSVFVMLAGLLSTGSRTVNSFFAKNTGILERKFGALLTTRLLEVLAKLDYPAAIDPMNNKLVTQAARTAQTGSDRAFKVVADMIKTFTTLAGVISQAEYLRRSLTKDNADLFVIGLIANFVKSAQWLFLGDSGVYSGVTNQDFHRMDNLWTEAADRIPEDNLLGLPSYLHDEYKKADERMGDLWTSRVKAISGLKRATTYLNTFSTPVIYALFALRASTRRSMMTNNTSSNALKATFTTDMLTFIETSTSSLAQEVGNFFFVLDDVREHCSKILQYYRVLDLKPQMPVPDVPMKYEKQVLKMNEDGEGMVGMSIEFRNVEYQYPDSDKHALRNVNFSIKPGSLVCIVGYNGAGKSTLINLMTRIVDPTDGTVLINGVDAKQYDPKDLYSHISCQFQQTYPVNFTLREWLHTGDVTVANDEERMQECLKITGADRIIAKFPKGLDARLGPYPADDTPQSLLREFIQETKTGGFDPWEANYDIKLEQDIERDDDYDDDTVIGLGQQKKKDCAFSPGEWSKLVIARALMRKSADLRIFDEPTAKLDPIASRAVFDQIESLRGKCTVIHITHDLSACLKADQVILFEDSTNMESGTHEDLLSRPDSKYREFYTATLGRGDDGGDSDDEEEEETEADVEKDGADVLATEANFADDENSGAEEVEGEASEQGTPEDPHLPAVVQLSWIPETDSQSGNSPECTARIVEINEDELEDHKIVEDPFEEDEKEDDDDDSGFEASSQSSFGPEKLPASKD